VLPVEILAAAAYRDHLLEVMLAAAAVFFPVAAVAGQDVVVRNNFIQHYKAVLPNREDFFYVFGRPMAKRFMISFNTPIRTPCNLKNPPFNIKEEASFTVL
jgi:hypothetical protein